MEWLTIIITLLLCSSVGINLIKKLLKWKNYVDTLNRIPGPPAWKLVSNLSPERLMVIDREEQKIYGSFYRFWNLHVGQVCISKAEYMEIILKSPDTLEKSFQYRFLEPWLGTGILTASGSKSLFHRKLIIPSFHFNVLESFVDIFYIKSQILVNRLEEIPSGNEFDIFPLINRCTLDIICETAMGINMNSQTANQENQEEAKFTAAVRNLLSATVSRIMKPWLYSDWVFFSLSSHGKKYAEFLKTFHNFTAKVISEKNAERAKNQNGISKNSTENDKLGRKKNVALLDLLLDTAEAENVIITDKETRDEIDTFLLAGHDTTTAAISWALFLLGNHPEIQNKVVEELNNIFQGAKRRIMPADLREMKYLEMVLKETLRLYPSLTVIARQSKKDVQLGEYTVPAGTVFRLLIYHLHRNPDYYKNPDVFNPDNFLPKNIKDRHPYAYVPFSAGPRSCIGQKFAIMESKTILASILLNFFVRSVEKVEDVIPVPELILKPKTGIKVKLYRRTSK